MEATDVLPLIISLVYAGIGAANARRQGESFQPSNFAITAVIGAILSGVGMATSLTANQVADASFFSVLSLLADKVASAFHKKPATA